MGQDDFGSDYITVSDEDGNQIELEFIMSFDVDDKSYMAFFPADMNEDDPDYGYVILKVIEENGEEIFVTVDDEKELDKAYDTFITLLVDDEEEE
ncbi:MAG: DUF1292 domain-containing protein [Oscillospiraceae bacterium]